MSETIPNYEEASSPQGFGSFVKDLGPLYCDLYALTMAQGAFRLGFIDETQSTSHVFCRALVNNGQTYLDAKGERQSVKMPYLVNAGQGIAAEWLSGWRFTEDDLRYLATLRTPSAKEGETDRLFSNAFLHYLSKQKLSLTIDAMPEGELIFPQEPAMRIKGPWWQQQMVEAAMLSAISAETNQATMAVQVRLAAERLAKAEGATLAEMSAKESASLAEMALRRTPDIGGLHASRAAFIAGWDNSSNVYAGKCYGIPVMGTFAHSWVMLHDTEEEAFENWAKAYPNTTVFLVDTYDSLEGVKKAIAVCKKYGLNLKGIRLDSGDMDYLASEARVLLKEAGYGQAAILATDAVNARAAYNLFGLAKTQVTGFGIGSEVAVNQYQPLLSEVLKLAHVAWNGQGRDVLKYSESRVKTTFPGEIDVIRYLIPTAAGPRFAGDTIVAREDDFGNRKLNREIISVHAETGAKKPFLAGTPFYRPIQPWMKNGAFLDPATASHNATAMLREARTTCAQSLARLDPEHKRLDMPRRYGWGIEAGLLAKRDGFVDRRDLEAARRKQSERFNLEL